MFLSIWQIIAKVWRQRVLNIMAVKDTVMDFMIHRKRIPILNDFYSNFSKKINQAWLQLPPEPWPLLILIWLQHFSRFYPWEFLIKQKKIRVKKISRKIKANGSFFSWCHKQIKGNTSSSRGLSSEREEQDMGGMT